jgi:hypothetical protein
MEVFVVAAEELHRFVGADVLQHGFGHARSVLSRHFTYVE